MLPTIAAGFFAGLALIVAIGAQNAFVLRQGVLRSHVGAVVAVCALSDIVLICAGVAGVGVLVESAGWLIDVTRWLGVAFLVGYGVFSLRRAFSPQALEQARTGAGALTAVVAQALALTWLNPHVYLDTVVLLGSIAQNQSGGRWWFALGACLGSIVWFTALGFGARLLAPLLARPRAWQVLDVVIALVMFTIAFSLATH